MAYIGRTPSTRTGWALTSQSNGFFYTTNFQPTLSSVLSGNISATKFLLNGNATITAGSGVPSTSEPNGSVFLRSDGNHASTFYVRSGGVWATPFERYTTWKDPCRVATTANITLSGTQTIDGVSVAAGERVLVKSQTTGSENGIYVVAAGAWARSADAVTSGPDGNLLLLGLTVYVSEGTANAERFFTLTATNTFTDLQTSLIYVWKQPVRVATTANITLSGAQTIDGVSAVAGDRVLVKNQTTASQNGVYTVATSTWTRTSDASLGTRLSSGSTFYVSEGTANGQKFFYLATTGAITIGSTSLSFAQLTAASNVEQRAVTTTTTSVTVTVNDHTIAVGTLSTPITVTLPSSPVLGQFFQVKDMNASAATNAITVSGNGNNIDGASTFILNVNYAAVRVQWTGTVWSIL